MYPALLFIGGLATTIDFNRENPIGTYWKPDGENKGPTVSYSLRRPDMITIAGLSPFRSFVLSFFLHPCVLLISVPVVRLLCFI